MTLSLAAWLAFYNGDFDGLADLPPRDALEMVACYGEIGALKASKGVEPMVRAYLRTKPSGSNAGQ